MSASANAEKLPAEIAKVSAEDRFLFDLQGFIILRGALSPDKCKSLLGTLRNLENKTYDDDAWRQRLKPSHNKLAMGTKHVEGYSTRLNGLLRLDPTFDQLIDHPATLPYLREFMDRPQLINTWSISKHRDTHIGGWHRGCMPTQYHCHEGLIRSEMVNEVWFLTDNGPDDGCMAAVPGSHKSDLADYTTYIRNPVLKGGADFPYQSFSGLALPGSIPIVGKAGDVVLFSEALIHTGLYKSTDGIRSNLYFNHFDRNSTVAGYEPHNMRHFWLPDRTRERFTPTRREMTDWMENARYEIDE